MIEVRKHLAPDAPSWTCSPAPEASASKPYREVAHSVLFVEQSAAAVDHIAKTARQFGVDRAGPGRLRTRAESFLGGHPRPFDLVFADPPYDYPRDGPTCRRSSWVNGWLKPDGWFILEHDKRHHFGEHPGCVFTKPYGRTIATIFRVHATPDPMTRNACRQCR
jgi:16S rRNA (guanine966-N2)-methyltransferase